MYKKIKELVHFASCPLNQFVSTLIGLLPLWNVPLCCYESHKLYYRQRAPLISNNTASTCLQPVTKEHALEHLEEIGY